MSTFQGPLHTTQIYTQVSIRKLKEIHAATHPARLERSRKAKLENTTLDELKEELDDAEEEES